MSSLREINSSSQANAGKFVCECGWCDANRITAAEKTQNRDGGKVNVVVAFDNMQLLTPWRGLLAYDWKTKRLHCYQISTRKVLPFALVKLWRQIKMTTVQRRQRQCRSTRSARYVLHRYPWKFNSHERIWRRRSVEGKILFWKDTMEHADENRISISVLSQLFLADAKRRNGANKKYLYQSNHINSLLPWLRSQKRSGNEYVWLFQLKNWKKISEVYQLSCQTSWPWEEYCPIITNI